MSQLIKKAVLSYLADNPHQNFTKTSLRRLIGIPHGQHNELLEAVKQLVKEGLCVLSKKQKLKMKSGISFTIGKFYSNSKGYGFVVNREEKIAIFIPKEGVQDAMHEDLVVAVITKHSEGSKNPEGKVISILKRDTESIVGTYMNSEEFGFVVPDDTRFQKDIYIPNGFSKDAKSYDKVVCKITKYPHKDRKPEGEVIEVIGVKWDKGVDLLSILKDKKIPQEFPPEVLRQSDSIPEVISTEERARRLDLRNEIVFTIDGEDAKDLDDAISIRKLENGNYYLGVHIADVAHYVRERSRIDLEALQRGTSIYLIDTVIPMLPKKLSNHLCSLRPNEDKLTLSVFMEIDSQGGVTSHSIHESVICSKARLTYTAVTDYLVNKTVSFAEQYPFLLQELEWMKEVALILEAKRKVRGAIEFAFEEAKVILNDSGEVEDVRKYDRGIANDMIEECMLVCNETVAEHFMKEAIPFVYRVHEKPREERLQEFKTFIEYHGFIFESAEDPDPKELQGLLEQFKGTPIEHAANFVLLRSMMQAKYSSVSKGHFGLSTQYYSHFTSPIRRYPDLQIHRIIKEYLNNELTTERKNALEKVVEASSLSSSRRERVAEQAEDEYKDLKKAEFMRGKIGETYLALISSMNNSSLTIMLDNTIEGIIPISWVTDDEFVYDETIFEWVGQKNGVRIRLGDQIVVRVKEVHMDQKEIRFDIVSL